MNPVRVLGPEDVEAFLALTAQDPVVNVFAEFRARTTRLDPRWLGGQVVGLHRSGELVGALHLGANLVPVGIQTDDVAAFAEAAMRARGRVSTMVGRSAPVEAIWRQVGPRWDEPRDVRPGQLHMEIAGPAQVEPHPDVRRTNADDFDAVYPACVAMYTEEVGVSPELGGAAMYQTRVRQLIGRGWQFAIIEGGRAIFKAEVACASPYAAQVQGVYVVPDRRGEGLASHGMAAVAEMIRADVAPVASLYVNAHNLSARRAYERAGFTETAKFTTIMF
ncbi:GNAT family N-acetyltransferase [Nocardioides sp. AE5]|uniref:GNAT family N-acetyltransferase n=1 Tax=Nocardioides sp. AE5 TaxID=2962573 RepID=UPI002882BD20|nr:GNAT family N-acetyltransferase [Nocardioides sp. AE5]MDT0201123.1 GNAT family N-acetyltransferase [Nocardioides sp. AE5]